MSIQLTPITDSQFAPGSYQAPQGYNLPPDSYVLINGEVYKTSGNGQMLTRSGPSETPFAKNAKDISTYGTTPETQAQQQIVAPPTTGNPNGAGASATQVAPAPGASVGTPGGTSGSPSASSPDLQSVLGNSNLTADQKQAIQAIYDAVASNDKDYATRIATAMTAATQYSDPYFKAQIKMSLDALDRGLQAQAGDLQFKEQQLNNTLKDLQDSTASAKDYLTFEQQQQLKDLETNYKQQLAQTQDSLAASGMTSSSVRSNKEQLMGNAYNGMVESSNKSLQYKLGNLDQTLASQQRNTQQGLDYYQNLGAQQKLDMLGQYEAKLGTNTLQGAGYTDTLGGIGGELPRQQGQDALSFAQSTVA